MLLDNGQASDVLTTPRSFDVMELTDTDVTAYMSAVMCRWTFFLQGVHKVQCLSAAGGRGCLPTAWRTLHIHGMPQSLTDPSGRPVSGDRGRAVHAEYPRILGLIYPKRTPSVVTVGTCFRPTLGK
ncbi:hypothetical protein ACOMHN_015616 [Nucella lapillus]